MRHRLPQLLAAASMLMLVTLVAGQALGRIGETLYAVTAVLFPLALILLGTPRARTTLRVVVTLLGLLLTLSAVGILFLARAGASAERVAGLPPATWLMLLGLGFVPFVLLLWSYAATFDPGADRGHD